MQQLKVDMSELQLDDFKSGDENISDDILSPHRAPNTKNGVAITPQSYKTLPSSATRHEELYQKSHQRKLKQDLIYKNCIEKECTFSPKLVTKNSAVSKRLIKEAK